MKGFYPSTHGRCSRRDSHEVLLVVCSADRSSSRWVISVVRALNLPDFSQRAFTASAVFCFASLVTKMAERRYLSSHSLFWRFRSWYRCMRKNNPQHSYLSSRAGSNTTSMIRRGQSHRRDKILGSCSQCCHPVADVVLMTLGILANDLLSYPKQPPARWRSREFGRFGQPAFTTAPGIRHTRPGQLLTGMTFNEAYLIQ